ncbi:uncharacterized protein LOC108719656 [Xenopus laevis]|uniref:Uncharacterized protein LOC108719656 n=1 Tax=Xenopus laevis TaxID=8355 RepID=A0A8J1L5I7_XENLA|nr:uncharacterized protein LOC108719656 [Xenopus laevis]
MCVLNVLNQIESHTLSDCSFTDYCTLSTALSPDEIPDIPIPLLKILIGISIVLSVTGFVSLIYGARKEINMQKKRDELQEKLKNTKLFYSDFGPDKPGYKFIMESPGEKHTFIFLPGVTDLPKNVVTEIIAEAIKAQEGISKTDNKENNPNPVIIEEPQEEITEPQVIEPQVIEPTEELQEVVVETKEEKKKKWRRFPFSKGKGKKALDIEASQKNTNEPQIIMPTEELQEIVVDTKEKKKKKRRLSLFSKGKGKKAVNKEKINDPEEELQEKPEQETKVKENNAEIDLEKGKEEVAVETKKEKKKKWRFWYKKNKKEMDVTDLP